MSDLYLIFDDNRRRNVTLTVADDVEARDRIIFAIENGGPDTMVTAGISSADAVRLASLLIDITIANKGL